MYYSDNSDSMYPKRVTAANVMKVILYVGIFILTIAPATLLYRWKKPILSCRILYTILYTKESFQWWLSSTLTSFDFLRIRVKAYNFNRIVYYQIIGKLKYNENYIKENIWNSITILTKIENILQKYQRHESIFHDIDNRVRS